MLFGEYPSYAVILYKCPTPLVTSTSKNHRPSAGLYNIDTKLEYSLFQKDDNRRTSAKIRNRERLSNLN